MIAAVHLSVSDWVALVLFVALAVLASTGIRGVWNGESGTNLSVRWARGLPTFFAVGWAMIVAVPLGAVVTSQKAGSTNPWLGLLLFVVLAVVIVGTLIGIAACLTGHPEGVVPPHLRKKAVVGRHVTRSPG